MNLIREITSDVTSSVIRGLARGSSGGGASSPLVDLALDGITASVAISTQYLGGVTGQVWADARLPTIRVERGYGSTAFQDLYPDPTTGELFTAPDGGGVSATAFADGEKLLVETPYNQSLADTSTGHPTPISASHRVLLDISVPTSPCFAGIAQGDQDASQHATERGYDLNVSVITNLGLNVLSCDQSSGTAQYWPFRNNGGTSLGMRVDADANQRWFNSAISFVNRIVPTSRPSAKAFYIQRRQQRATIDSIVGTQGAYQQGSGQFAINATSTPLRMWGALNPLTGRAFAFVAWAGETGHSVVEQATRRTQGYAKGHFAAGEISLFGPKTLQGFAIDLDSDTGSIFIECASGPGRAIEASFNGGSYQTIGTTDSGGYLAATLDNVAPGRGTLGLRVVGQTTVTSVSNISVGVFVAALGQSNALGRGDDYTFSPTIGSRQDSGDWVALPATNKSWVAKFGIDLATEKSSPLVYHNTAAGATFLYFDSGGSTDGRHGHWAFNNPGTVTVNNFADSVRNGVLWYGQANFIVWHQGESEGVGGVTVEQYETSLVNMWSTFQQQTGLTKKLWIMQIGRNGTASDSAVDAIRQAQVNAVYNRPDLFEFGGCLAHLAVEDTLDSGQNVHFYTTAQKDAVAAVFKRHSLGFGRGPRFSSASKSGSTITITCTGGVSPLTIDSGEAASPIGWTVSDEDGSRNVSSVAVSGLTITLTLDQSITGTATVKWLSHYTGIGTTLLDSDATTPVPPEPFQTSI